MKNIVTDRYLEAASLASSFDGAAFDCASLHAPFIQLVVTNASSLDGAVKVQGTSDIAPGTSQPQNWVDLAEFASKTITTNGVQYWQIFASTLTPRFIRLVYTKTAGSGNLTAIISGVKI